MWSTAAISFCQTERRRAVVGQSSAVERGSAGHRGVRHEFGIIPGAVGLTGLRDNHALQKGSRLRCLALPVLAPSNPSK